MPKFVTCDDVIRDAEEMAGKRFILPNELRAAISRGLLEMKELGTGERGTCYENHAPDVISNRLKNNFIETNLK